VCFARFGARTVLDVAATSLGGVRVELKARDADRRLGAVDHLMRTLSTMISPETIEYLDSGKIRLQDARDDDIFQGRLGPEHEYWDRED
jgi:hypothetical protein